MGRQDWWVGREGTLLRINEAGEVYLRPGISGGGGGSAGSTRTTQQVQQVDPWLTKVNELAYGQIKAGADQTGGLPKYLEENPYAFYNPEEQAIIGQIGESTKTWGNLTEQEQLGLSDYERLADPTLAMSTAQDVFNQYAAPIIRNDATVRGQGRQGVVPESLSSGFAQMALPILQSSMGAREGLAKTRMTLGPELLNRQVQGLETALRTAGADRQQAGAEYMRPLETIAGIVGGLPLGGGSVSGYQTGRTNAYRGDFDWLGDLVIPLVGAIAGGAAGCWLSTQVLGPKDAIRWRAYLYFRAPRWERLLYSAISRVTRGRVPFKGLFRAWFKSRIRR